MFLIIFVDDIIKQNRAQRRKENKKKPTNSPRGNEDRRKGENRPQNRRNRRNDKNKNMMDTTPVVNERGGIQKARNTNDKRNPRDRHRGGKVIVRSDSGRPASLSRRHNNNPSTKSVAKSTPGLRQPWEKLPVAPLPAEPLKISIRNELADRPPARRSDMMMDTDSGPIHRTGSLYEPRDSLSSREEYRIGNRFSTQGMAIDYQLPSGASYDTRPTRRY